MIPLCFPQQLLLRGQDSPDIQLLSYRPEIGKTLDPFRVYLFLEETYYAMVNNCQSGGMKAPIVLVPEIVKTAPKAPLELKKYWQWQEPKQTSRKGLRVCLINGGGGGLGDAVMFAPALKILRRRLKEQNSGISDIRLDVFSSLSRRTEAIMGNISGVRVRPLPLTLHEFTGYDLYTDFSGMMLEESFAHTHMTDFALNQMGIEAATVEDLLK